MQFRMRPFYITFLPFCVLALGVTLSTGDRHIANLCDQTAVPTSVMCYCNSHGLQPNEATSAQCWIFNDTKPSDTIWDDFATQSYLTEWRVILRPDGSLHFVPTRALRHLPRLISLEIQSAAITKVDSYALANLTNLQDAQLSRNQIMSLNRMAFAKLPGLITLALSENRIPEIHYGVFGRLPNLKTLYLDRNNISVIFDRAFENLRHLEELDINENELTNITHLTFAGLRRLQRLDLHRNRLERLPDYAFAEAPELRQIDLMANSLKYILPRAFWGLPYLEYLNMNDNKLTSIDSQVFRGSLSLMTLDLRNNVLETLHRDTIMEPLGDRFKNASAAVFLEGNNFICDCRLNWMYELWNATGSDFTRSILEQTTCFLRPKDQKEMKGKKKLSLKDIKEPNKITPRKNDGSADDDSNFGFGEIKYLFDIPVEQLPCPNEYQQKDVTVEPTFATTTFIEEESDNLPADSANENNLASNSHNNPVINYINTSFNKTPYNIMIFLSVLLPYITKILQLPYITNILQF